MQPSQFLTCWRAEDVGDDLWSVLNRCQENLLVGGLSRRAVSDRLTRTRRITSIREDMRRKRPPVGLGNRSPGRPESKGGNGPSGADWPMLALEWSP